MRCSLIEKGGGVGGGGGGGGISVKTKCFRIFRHSSGDVAWVE